MAAIRETLILEDKFTSTMTQCLQVAQRMANMLDDVRASTMNVETAAAATAVQMQELAGKMTQTNSRGTSLLGTIRNLAGTFLGMQSVRWLVNTSDQLTSINARLRLMTGSAEAAAAGIADYYKEGATVSVHALNEPLPENGLYSNALSGSDRMELYMTVNAAGDQMMLVSLFDNLGKGSSGAAIQCMNLMLGMNETEGLE